MGQNFIVASTALKSAIAGGDGNPLERCFAPSAQESLVTYQGDGLRLRGTALWFDAPTARELCFVSHALLRRARQHSRVLTSQQSEALLRALDGSNGHAAAQRRVLAVPLYQRFALGELSLELLPSGYLLGSSSALVQWRGTRVLYSGPLSLRETPLSAPPEPRRCDLLVLHCPPVERPEGQIARSSRRKKALLRFIEQTFADAQTPVIVCSPIGTAQYIASMLLEHEIALRVHPQIRAVSRVYAEQQRRCVPRQLAQLRGIGRSNGLDPKRRPEVLLWPTQLAQSRVLRELDRIRVAPLIEQPPGELDRESTVALRSYLEECDPQQVLLCGTPSATLLATLGASGRSVGICRPAEQLEMFAHQQRYQ